MKKKFVPVDVVIVTYNSDAVIGHTLGGITDAQSITVVDNASANDIGQYIAQDRVMIIRNRNNLGFGTACNQGAKVGHAPYVLFLNPDTHCDNAMLVTFIEQAEQYPDAGAFNPRLLDEHNKTPCKAKSLVCGKYHEKQTGSGDVVVPFLSGSALLVRRRIFEAIEGFDEDIFLFHEDDDLCRRITEAGHKLIVLQKVTVFHKGGSSSGNSTDIVRKKAFWEIRAQRHVARKYGLSFVTARKVFSACLRLLPTFFGGKTQRRARLSGRIAGLLASSRQAERWK